MSTKPELLYIFTIRRYDGPNIQLPDLPSSSTCDDELEINDTTILHHLHQ